MSKVVWVLCLTISTLILDSLLRSISPHAFITATSTRTVVSVWTFWRISGVLHWPSARSCFPFAPFWLIPTPKILLFPTLLSFWRRIRPDTIVRPENGLPSTPCSSNRWINSLGWWTNNSISVFDTDSIHWKYVLPFVILKACYFIHNVAIAAIVRNMEVGCFRLGAFCAVHLVAIVRNEWQQKCEEHMQEDEVWWSFDSILSLKGWQNKYQEWDVIVLTLK